MAELALAFEGVSVRSRFIDDEPCVLLADVIAVLDLKSSPSQVAQRLPDGVRKTDPIVDSLGRTQDATWLTEAGFYRVALRSNSPKAEPLIQWVTEEVLPQIRRSGGYQVELSDDELMHRALTVASRRVEEFKARAELAERQVAVATPKAEAFEAFLAATGDYSVNEAAKTLSRDHNILTGEKRLRTWMLSNDWLYRDGYGAPRAYQARIDQGVLTEKAQWHYHPSTGQKVIDPPQVRVTAKGLGRLRELLLSEKGA